MKKLNRKGFTLIELLAVIVILAIVLVVTIPSVISSMNSAKEKSLSNAAATVTEWFTKQYELATLGVSVDGNVDSAYTKWVTDHSTWNETAEELTADVLKAAGLTDTTGLINEGSTAQLTNGKICINLQADTTSQFHVAGSETATGPGC